MAIEIVNWKEFQHYKERLPPWIKLHRKLHHNRNWRELDGDAAKLLVDLWMLACEDKDGAITMPIDDLAWRLRLSGTIQLARMLQVLQDKGFVKLLEHYASAALAGCAQDAAGETEQSREETEEQITFANANEEQPRIEKEHVESVGAVLAPLIREHLWRGDKPPRLRRYPGWHMGREISMADDLIKKARITVQVLAGAIEVARETLHFDGDEPLTLLIFNVAGRLDRLNECVGAWHKLQARVNGPRRAGPQRVEVHIG